MCRFFGVSRSGYYAHIEREKRPAFDQGLADKISPMPDTGQKDIRVSAHTYAAGQAGYPPQPENHTSSYTEIWSAFRSAPPQISVHGRTSAQISQYPESPI